VKVTERTTVPVISHSHDIRQYMEWSYSIKDYRVDYRLNINLIVLCQACSGGGRHSGSRQKRLRISLFNKLCLFEESVLELWGLLYSNSVILINLRKNATFTTAEEIVGKITEAESLKGAVTYAIKWNLSYFSEQLIVCEISTSSPHIIGMFLWLQQFRFVPWWKRHVQVNRSARVRLRLETFTRKSTKVVINTRQARSVVVRLTDSWTCLKVTLLCQ